MDPMEYLNSLSTRRYKCCRGHIHVRKGALLVGVIELFWSSAIVFVFIVDFAVGHFRIPNTVFTIGITTGIVYCGGVILMFFGVRRCRAKLLIPHLVLMIITLVIFFLLMGFSIFVFALSYKLVEKTDPEMKDSDRSDFLVMTIFVVSTVSLAFELWFVNVVYKCYRYLKAKEQYEKYSNRMNRDLSTTSRCPLEPTDYVELNIVHQENRNIT